MLRFIKRFVGALNDAVRLLAGVGDGGVPRGKLDGTRHRSVLLGKVFDGLVEALGHIFAIDGLLGEDHDELIAAITGDEAPCGIGHNDEGLCHDF